MAPVSDVADATVRPRYSEVVTQSGADPIDRFIRSTDAEVPRLDSLVRMRSCGQVRLALRALACTTALTLAACGGGSGDGAGDTPTAAGNPLVPGSTDAGATAAGDVDTEGLQRNAFARTMAGVGINVGYLRRLNEDANDGDATGEGLLDGIDDGAGSVFGRTLGIDDPNARVTRAGDVVTIDPDDATLCRDDPAVAVDDGLGGDGMDSICRQLVASLATRLEAFTADSGIITYLFDGEPVLSTGYSPSGVTQEVRLSGVATVLRRLETIIGIESGTLVPTTLDGTLRWAADVLDDTPGEASGTFELTVTETLRIGDDGERASLSLAPSRVVRLAFDESTDDVTANVAWGALQLASDRVDEAGGTSSTTLSLGGLTFDLSGDTDDDAPSVTLSNVGIGDVPLNIRVDSVDAVTLALETFGVTLDGAAGGVTFDTALGVDLMIDNLGGLLEDRARDFGARLTAAVAAGSSLIGRDDGLVEVEAGSVSAILEAGDGVSSTRSEIEASAGSCIGERDREADGTAGLADDERPDAAFDLASSACP